MIQLFQKKKSSHRGMLNELIQLTDIIEYRLHLGVFKIPVLPKMTARIIGLAVNSDTDFEDVTNLISQDHAQASQILRISNSAPFRENGPIKSMKEAVGRLGLSMVGEMATVISIRGHVFQVKEFEKDVERIWLHALVSAYFGKEIAWHLNENHDSQFMCGLFHTVGKPILLQMISDLGGIIIERGGPNYALQELVKRLHANAGRVATRHWNLPDPIIASCAHYQRRFETNTHRREIGMTYLSSKLAEWCLTKNKGLADCLKHDSIIEELGLEQDALHSLFAMNEEILSLATALTSAI